MPELVFFDSPILFGIIRLYHKLIGFGLLWFVGSSLSKPCRQESVKKKVNAI